MAENDASSELKVSEEVREGGVELSGFINTSWERDAAVKLASENASVNGIVNLIDIMRERPESINKNQGE